MNKIIMLELTFADGGLSSSVLDRGICFAGSDVEAELWRWGPASRMRRVGQASQPAAAVGQEEGSQRKGLKGSQVGCGTVTEGEHLREESDPGALSVRCSMGRLYKGV